MTDFILTRDQLAQILEDNEYIDDWHAALSQFLPEYGINSPERVAGFLAQCGHESNNFNTLKENLNYRWQTLRRVFPKHFPTDEIAQQYAHKKEAIANRAYANRMGNGPEESGDGFRFSGKGLIQLTGKNNYQEFSNESGIDIDDLPEYLLSFEGAVHSACWFWNMRNLNDIADAGDISEMTRLINGGYHGLEDRESRYNRILEIINGQ